MSATLTVRAGRLTALRPPQAWSLAVAAHRRPARVRADRAARLGLTPDPDFDSIIRMHLAESRPEGDRGR